MRSVGALGTILLVMLTCPVEAFVLITPEEAALPLAATAQITKRAGVTRGPKVSLRSPNPKAEFSAPVDFRLVFQAFGGASIAPNAVKLTYVRNPAVDLTDRVRPYLAATGIDIQQTEMPPGEHTIRIDVTDTDGRSTTELFVLKVQP